MKKKSSTTRKKSKKLSTLEKKTYALVAVGILSVCALLLVFSFLVLPSFTNRSTLELDTESIAKEINAIEASEITTTENSKVEAQITQTKVQSTQQQNLTSANTQSQTSTAKEQSTTNKTQNTKSENVKAKQQSATQPTTHETTTTTNAKTQTTTEQSTQQQTTATQQATNANSSILVFVFDDAGHNMSQLEAFLSLPFPCTFAVLPGLSHTQDASKKIKTSKHEMILHQPMQAINKSLNPGPGAITEELTTDEVKTILQNNLDEIGTSVGLNNHEGSLITSNYSLMKAVLEVVKMRNLIFLDSRTNAETVAPLVASELGMQILERNIFLDNSKNVDDMKEQIKKGLEHAKKNGSVIMIGHVFTTELAKLLKELYPSFVQQGFQFKTVSEYAKLKFAK